MSRFKSAFLASTYQEVYEALCKGSDKLTDQRLSAPAGELEWNRSVPCEGPELASTDARVGWTCAVCYFFFTKRLLCGYVGTRFHHASSS
jgi:hypothetical protein